MKRSEINAIMKDALKLFDEYKISLPPFAKWTPEEWKQKGEETQEIKDNMLGWDITDYGQGDFDKVGLLLITLRNGSQANPEKYAKPYAEKLMLVREKQLAPMHFHWYKMEDIINRGGGNLMLQLYNSTADEQLADTEVTVSMDGVQKTLPAGTIVRLTPGESITLPKGLYHSFWGEEGKGTVIVQEVSMTNDDNTDNRFYETVGRFPEIEEDEAPLHLIGGASPLFLHRKSQQFRTQTCLLRRIVCAETIFQQNIADLVQQAEKRMITRINFRIPEKRPEKIFCPGQQQFHNHSSSNIQY